MQIRECVTTTQQTIWLDTDSLEHMHTDQIFLQFTYLDSLNSINKSIFSI